MSEHSDIPHESSFDTIVEEICAPLGEGVARRLPTVLGEARVLVPSYAFSWAAELLAYKGARLITHVGLDSRDIDSCYRVVAAFDLGPRRGFLSIETTLEEHNPVYPSLTPKIPAAHWAEREVKDLLGLSPEGHPFLRPLVLHDLPENIYPLRRDFEKRRWPLAPGKAFQPVPVHNEGITRLSLGPFRQGDGARFVLQSDGEVIISAEAQRFYHHRGIEKQAEGLPVLEALPLAERLCAACSAAHAYSFCAAVERLAGTEAPARARALRVLILELERILSHANDLGRLTASLGASQAHYHASLLKERASRLAAEAFGHRRLMNTFAPGGVRRDLSKEQEKRAVTEIAALKSHFDDLSRDLLENGSALERLEGIGLLSPEIAQTLGAVGIVSRACQIDYDVRRDHPYDGYREIPPQTIPLETEGDAAARTRLRLAEIKESLRLCENALALLPGGPIRADIQEIPPGAALGYAESPRGETVTYLHVGTEGAVRRYRVRSASYFNAATLPSAVLGGVLEDFPLVEQSFGLCTACMER